MFTAAAAPVTTQLNCVRRERPTPIATTTYPAKGTTAKERGPTTRDALWNAGAAIHSTIHGERSASAVETQLEIRTR